MSNQTITVDYHGQQLTAIERDGEPWFTATVVGRELGYTKANARIGVSNLYQRHKDEFSEADTGVIKLITNSQGGSPNTRLFSLSGIILLGFLSNTDRAKQFRRWAKQELEQRLRSQSPASLEQMELALHSSQIELVRARPIWARIERYKALGLNHREIGQLVGRNSNTVRKHVRRMEAVGLLSAPANLPALQSRALHLCAVAVQ